MTTIVLNEAQNKAYKNLTRFLDSTKINEFILLGPAGSGKTTVIVNAFNNKNIEVAFCAFTNKATQVLKKISEKFSINFVADFMTIHSLLRLDHKYLDNEKQIAFSFDTSKIEYLKKYKVLIFDECSTISKELYGYIREAQTYIKFVYGFSIKLIFLGDYWQLPPVSEDKSVVFNMCKEQAWPIAKLEKVMRSANDEMQVINNNMLSWIPKFKNGHVDDFVQKFPYNLIPRNKKTYLPLDDFMEKFLETWRTGTPDTVILTYSKNNCVKTNHEIQDRLDILSGRDIPQSRDVIKFHVGDRCCLERPVNLQTIVRKKDKLPLNITAELDAMIGNKIVEIDIVIDKPDSKSDGKIGDKSKNKIIDKVFLDTSTGVTLYNGEIFDILNVEDVQVVTPLNRLKYIADTFDGQLLTIARIHDASVKYEIIHIPESTINEARKLIKENERKMFYLNLMSDFISRYPCLDYGYCITIYKSQGSEWDTVFVNISSIKWSIVGKGYVANYKKKAQLFKTSYTALSRASKKIYCFWPK